MMKRASSVEGPQYIANLTTSSFAWFYRCNSIMYLNHLLPPPAGPHADNTNSLEGCWRGYEPPTAPFPGTLMLGTGAEDYPESGL